MLHAALEAERAAAEAQKGAEQVASAAEEQSAGASGAQSAVQEQSKSLEQGQVAAQSLAALAEKLRSSTADASGEPQIGAALGKNFRPRSRIERRRGRNRRPPWSRSTRARTRAASATHEASAALGLPSKRRGKLAQPEHWSRQRACGQFGGWRSRRAARPSSG